MRRLTLCLPYYMNAGMLKLQLDLIEALPQAVRDELAVIVVDDGSPDGEAQGREIGCPLEIYRIDVDVRWNQDAARNIAVHESDTRWLLLTDMDHLVPRKTYEAILKEKLRKEYVYRFSRTTLERTGRGPETHETPYKPHPNSWLISRDLYDKIGGYDERFAGYYGSDADFRNRVARAAADVIMRDEVIIRVPRETIPDASTTTYLRKQPEDVAISRIRAERDQLPDWRPLSLTFPYHQIYPLHGQPCSH